MDAESDMLYLDPSDDSMEAYRDEAYADDDELFASARDDFSFSYGVSDLWEDCLVPTLRDGSAPCLRLLLCCLLLRAVASSGYFAAVWIHIASAVLGGYCLYSFFGVHMIYVVLLGLAGLTSLTAAQVYWKKHCGLSCAMVSIVFIVTCELFLVDVTHWHKIRGAQMVLAMKLVSLGFDVDTAQVAPPPVVRCLGYLFCGGTVLFGPWTSFSKYAEIECPRPMTLTFFWRTACSAFLAFLFLTVSTCWASWFLPYDAWRWIAAYRDALSFRTSHYFVCYVSQTAAMMLGISPSGTDWHATVVAPRRVEVPRSLVEVVIYWNMPMHYWLKTYVFKNAKVFGNFWAILLTYCASSLLHGLNFQLAAVLLSLGFYTYVEHALRQKMATIFNACILAKPCKKDCVHLHQQQHPAVIAVNLGFGLLAAFHLIYLGVMFDSGSHLQEEGYAMHHTLKKWSELGFASHWVTLATYLFYFLI